MTQRRIHRLGIFLLILSASLPVRDASAQRGSGDDSPVDHEHLSLLEEARAYLKALHRAAMLSTARADLSVALMVFRDAQEYEIVDRLVTELSKEKPLPLVLDALRKEKKDLGRLRGKVGVRLELIHPRHDPRIKPGQAESVHLFVATLDRSAPLLIGKKRQAWAPWRRLPEMKPSRVRIARHYKFVNRREIPIISELTPKAKRLVFRGGRRSIWGLLAPSVLESKNRRVRLSLPHFDAYRGPFDDRQIVDLNVEGHSWQRGLSLKLEGSLPKTWPKPPERLEKILDHFRAEETQ